MSKLSGEVLTLPKMSGSVLMPKSLNGNVGAKTINIGEDGATFIPSVSADGVISWTNDKELPNPDPVNIKGDAGYTPQKGVDYFDGKDGQDGTSPIISVLAITGGHRITITDKKGTKSVDVLDGQDGKEGSDGADGQDGADGVGIASIEQTTTSTADDGNNVITITLTNGQTATFTVQNGSKGSTGPAGKDGAKGDKGDTGPQGEQGPQGIQGIQGERGEQGLKGDKGDRGEQGPQGVQGEKGDKGDKGDTGATGANGKDGKDGAVGPQGPKGDKGDKGDTGATGPKGSDATVTTANIQNALGYTPAKQTDVTNLSKEIDDQQALIDSKQPQGNYALKNEIPSVEGLALKTYVDSEVADLKAQGVQQTPLTPEDGNTVETQLAWLKANGDTDKVYLLANGNIASYTYIEKAVGGYTNMVDPSSSDFKAGYRYNASGAITTSSIEKDNCFVSDAFALETGDTLYIKGVRASTSTTATAPVFVAARLKSDGSNISNTHTIYLGQPLGATVTEGRKAWNAFDTLEDGTIKWTFAVNNAGVNTNSENFESGGSTVCKTRIAGVATDGLENVIVTINEPIVEPSIVKEYAWVDTGRAFIPTDYEDRIVELENKTAEHDVKLLEMEQQLNNIEIGVTEEVKWFALGDSITEGYASSLNADGTYKQFVTEAKNRWVDILAEKNGYTLTNKGIGGTGYLQGTNNARVLADNTDFSQCDIVTLAYGVNDWKYAVNIGSMADDINAGGSMVANMRYVIKKILADNPYCKIFVITPINCRSYGTYATNWGINYAGAAANNLGLQDIFDRMKEVCDYHGIEMIDMTHSSIVNRENIRTMLADYVHPTVECHKLMARELAKKINFV